MVQAETTAPELSTGGAPGIVPALCIVPARLRSTRLPEKLLLRETGRYLFEHTVRNARRCASLTRVVLAVDDPRLLAAATEVGIEAVSTSPAHESGTDRVREALETLLAAGTPPPAVVVNVQGDEPELDPEDLTRLVAAFAAPQVDFATLWVPLLDPAEAQRPEVVKLVTDGAGRALYFSRAPIPARGHGAPEPARQRHLGVYAYRPAALRAFCDAPPGRLERSERLEQLRWLEVGGAIHALEARSAPRGIDTRADYDQFLLRQRGAAAGAAATISDRTWTEPQS
jgi:3-deoxy-manno-octulosonate cytidylyltransferase (CMP-KDO synthetase)